MGKNRTDRQKLYVDFNVDPHDGPPLMYEMRDRSNQVLYLEPQSVRILHISDTHSLHWQVRLPAADLLLHTGDFTIGGTDLEFEDFDSWLGRCKNQQLFKHCLVIAGNHEFHEPSNRVCAGQLPAAHLLHPNYVRQRLRNATYLAHEEVTFEGMRIFGSTWEPYSSGCDPDLPGESETEQEMWSAHCSACAGIATPHNFDAIPAGTHVLMTHGPARGVLDWEFEHEPYGSSVALRERIVECGVQVHLFGHVHEQRGVFARNGAGGYDGGVEYVHPQTLQPPPDPGPPSPLYPCDIISNNAVKNNKRHEATADKHYIAGPPRMIIAHRLQGAGDVSEWRFVLEDDC
jgi:predicted phosphodiesterase